MNDRDKPVSTRKDLAKIATGSLEDSEVTLIGQVVRQLIMKYSALPITENNLSRLDDEATDTFHRMGYLVHLDIEPCLEGQPPILEIIGKVGDMGFQAPHDHEKSAWSVKKAHARNEFFYGEREKINPISKSSKKRLILPKDDKSAS